LGEHKRFRPKRRKPEGAVFNGKKVRLGIKKVHPYKKQKHKIKF
jgi:hypothetical protein